MDYDFTTLINRADSGAAKWQGQDIPEGTAPLSVADLDMKLAPEIRQGIIEYMQGDPVLGYTLPTDEYFQSVINWQKSRNKFEISREEIVLSPGIVPALNCCVNTYTKEGDGVIIFSPVYYPFENAIKNNGRNVVKCPLIYEKQSYRIDFDLFDKLSSQMSNKILLFCSPHNPVGRVWTREELEQLGRICLKNDVKIISDEIHGDLIMPGFTHYPMASLSSELAGITITCTAPSKSFNLAGLQGSNIIIKNKELRDLFVEEEDKTGFFSLNTLSYVATILAYTKGESWLEEFKKLIFQNYNLFCDFVRREIPDAKVLPLQGTYLLWVDCNAYGFSYKELKQRMVSNKLYLDEGYVFGEEGRGFERFNIACPTWVLENALERFKSALLG